MAAVWVEVFACRLWHSVFSELISTFEHWRPIPEIINVAIVVIFIILSGQLQQSMICLCEWLQNTGVWTSGLGREGFVHTLTVFWERDFWKCDINAILCLKILQCLCANASCLLGDVWGKLADGVVSVILFWSIQIEDAVLFERTRSFSSLSGAKCCFASLLSELRQSACVFTSGQNTLNWRGLGEKKVLVDRFVESLQ